MVRLEGLGNLASSLSSLIRGGLRLRSRCRVWCATFAFDLVESSTDPVDGDVQRVILRFLSLGTMDWIFEKKAWISYSLGITVDCIQPLLIPISQFFLSNTLHPPSTIPGSLSLSLLSSLFNVIEINPFLLPFVKVASFRKVSEK